jgi:hypothetical protein
VAAKFGLAAAVAILAVAVGTKERLWIGLAAAAALAAYAVRDVVARDRLTADHDGIAAISGFAGRTRLPWANIERMTVESRLRLGARTEILEVDAGVRIFQFSRFDLGVPPGDALSALEAVRNG